MPNGNHNKRPNRGSNPNYYHRRKRGKGRGRAIFFRHKNRLVREELRSIA